MRDLIRTLSCENPLIYQSKDGKDEKVFVALKWIAAMLLACPKGINGRETYEEIIKIRPDQKAIIASGYAKTKEVDTAQELGAGRYIKKPYILEKIGLAVKEELEK
jgi:DNA-binding NtrC family response regulator